MSRLLRYGLSGLGVLLLVLVLIPFVIPAGTYRARIEAGALEQTGRVLKIRGPLHVTLFPALGVRAADVRFANVPGGHATSFATMRELRVAVRLLPLLSGRVEISEIVLDRPVIALERGKDGRGNWTFKSSRASGFTTRFSGIRISDGAVSYRGSDGRVRAFEHADLTIGLTALDKPVTLDGEGLYRKRRVAVEARLANLLPLTPHQPRDVDLSLSSDLLQASFKGQVSGEGDSTGRLKLDTTNVPELADWLGEYLPRHAGIRTVSLEARLETQGAALSFPDESLRLDGMTITGHFAVDTAPKRPLITGDVVVDRLELNRYIDAGMPATPHRDTSGWSTAPIDLSLLHLFDAKLAIDTGALHLKSLRLSKTHLTAALDDGQLEVSVDPMSLYGGTGKAHLVVDARDAVPKFRNELSFTNVAMRSLLNDAMSVQRIAGRGALNFSVASEGNSANAIMHNLSGHGALQIDDGAIIGVDLGAVARLIRSAVTMQATGSGTTPFSRMSASFAISHGVLATRDFRMDSSLFRATGTGTVDIGNRTLDFLVKPKAVLLPLGGGLGVVFPFHAQGPWRSLTYSADVGGAVTGLVSDVFHGALSVPGAVGDFLIGGGGDKQKPKTGSKSTKKKSTGLFDGLFGH